MPSHPVRPESFPCGTSPGTRGDTRKPAGCGGNCASGGAEEAQWAGNIPVRVGLRPHLEQVCLCGRPWARCLREVLGVGGTEVKPRTGLALGTQSSAGGHRRAGVEGAEPELPGERPELPKGGWTFETGPGPGVFTGEQDSQTQCAWERLWGAEWGELWSKMPRV